MFTEKIIKSGIIPALFLLFSGTATGQEIIGNSQLNISLQEVDNGLILSGIKENSHEILMGSSSIFSLNIYRISGNIDETINSATGWNEIDITNNGDNGIIVFSAPANSNLPDSLQVTFSIIVSEIHSHWDLSVSGLGNDYSLTNTIFPDFKLKVEENDYFFVPKYSGKAIPDPVENHIHYELNYPRGWSATLPFMAYYNNNYGVYLGFHDPDASVKSFFIHTEDNGLDFHADIIPPDKTIANNNWELPGVFELDIFHGDWYDASMIYKEWASSEAAYWPEMTEARTARQQEIGRIGIWGYYASDIGYPMEQTEQDMIDYTTFFPGVPTGIFWYKWNYQDFDDNYPDYFPEREGMIELVSHLQQDGLTTIMPYINGRLYDTDLPDYETNGYPYATKRTNGEIYSQDFNNNHFAVMCPTQSLWQDILADASKQLTGRIGCRAVYIDQVCAAGPTECMDTTHHHSLAGGHWWRDGYREMFRKIHDSIPHGRFIAVEGGTDYLVDEVDGFLTQGWTSDHLVPAFQAIYSGKIQFYGTLTWTNEYNNQAFYCKLSQAFANGIQPGKFSLWIVHDPNATFARPFIRQLAVMRYKLHRFLAFGEMLRPLMPEGEIPDITSTWYDYGEPLDVTISAIQTGTYQNPARDTIIVIFANASMTDTLDFSFNFDGESYGLSGNLDVQEITDTINYQPEMQNNIFTGQASLDPMRTVAYKICEHSVSCPENIDRTALFVYPNPAGNRVFIYSDKRNLYKLYNIHGQLVGGDIIRPGKNEINVSEYPPGTYIFKFKTGTSRKVVIK